MMFILIMSLSYGQTISTDDYTLAGNVTFENWTIDRLTTTGGTWSITTTGCPRGNDCLVSNSESDWVYAYIENSTFDITGHQNVLIKVWGEELTNIDVDRTHIMWNFINASNYDGMGFMWVDNNDDYRWGERQNNKSVGTSNTGPIIDYAGFDEEWMVLNISTNNTELWVFDDSSETTLRVNTNYSFNYTQISGYVGFLNFRDSLYDDMELWTFGVASTGETPSITLNTNLTANTDSSNNPFTFSVDAIGAVVNTTTSSWSVNLYLNNTLNQTHYSTVNLNTTALILNLTYQGIRNVNVTVNNSNVSDSFVVNNIYLDSINPNVSITNFNNNTVFTRMLDGSQQPIVYATDSNIVYVNFTLFELISGTRTEIKNNSYINPADITTQDANFTFDINLLNESTYELYLEAKDNITTYSTSWFFNVSNGFTFYARDTFSNSALTNFTISIYNDSNNVLLQTNTTSISNLTFNITSGVYNVNITAPSYFDNSTANLTFSVGGNFTFYLTSQQTMVINFFDAKTDTRIPTNFSVTFIQPSFAVNRTQEGGQLNITDVPFVDGLTEIRYGGNGYVVRSYFIEPEDFTPEITVYTILNSTAALILFQTSDEKANPIFNATLKMQRYFVNDNSYKVISMEHTDENGQSGMYLEPNDVYYIAVLEKNGTVLYRSAASRLFSNLQYIQANILEDPLESYIKLRDGLSTSLTYDNDTSLLTYFFNDASGIVVEGCLEVLAQTILTETTLGPNCTSSSSATIVMNLSGKIQNQTNYVARGYVETNTAASTFYSDILNNFVSAGQIYEVFGNFGLFVAYLVVVSLFFMGLPNFPVSVAYTALSLIVINFIGISFFGVALITSISIGGIAIAKSNRM